MVINQQLNVAMEPGNMVDKYTLCVKKDAVIVAHLPLGKTGKSAESIVYFLQEDRYANFNVVITGKKVNLGDGKGMKDMFVEDFQDKANVRYIDTSQKYNKLNIPFFQAT